MKIFSISDIHASKKNSKGYNFLIKFIEHCLSEKGLDKVIFLGDIFDHMVGEHLEYFDKYQQFFKLLDQLVDKTDVVFVEGNHDFHLVNIFTKRYERKLTYIKDFYWVRDEKIKILFFHGDLIDLDDTNYKIFRKFIRSNFFYLFSSIFLKFIPVEKIGNLMTKNSKRYWSDNRDAEKIRLRYREYIQQFYLRYKFDYLFLGHTHVKDKFSTPDFTAINNGFSVKENCFISYQYFNVSFKNLN